MDHSLMDFIHGEKSVADMFSEIWDNIGLLPDHAETLEAATHTLNTNLEGLRNLHAVSQKLVTASDAAKVAAALQTHPLVERADHLTLLAFNEPWAATRPETIKALYATADAVPQEPMPLEAYAPIDEVSQRKPAMLTEEEIAALEVDYLADIGTRQLISYPLVSSGDWYGLLNLHAQEPDTWQSDDLPLLRPVVNQAAITTYNIHLRSRSQDGDKMFADVASLVHELRNPLTAIVGFSDTLLSGDIAWDVKSQRDFLETINMEARNLANLLEQLLDFTRMEAKALSVEQKPIQFGDVLADVLPTLEILTTDFVLTLHLAEGLPNVYVDAGRIGQVLTNLVENATKYAPEGTTISIDAHSMDDETVEVCIRDEGPGVPPEDRERIFEPFERGSLTTAAPGTGLGLPVCRGIIAAHGGTLELREGQEKGATFCFTLPTI